MRQRRSELRGAGGCDNSGRIGARHGSCGLLASGSVERPPLSDKVAGASIDSQASMQRWLVPQRVVFELPSSFARDSSSLVWSRCLPKLGDVREVGHVAGICTRSPTAVSWCVCVLLRFGTRLPCLCTAGLKAHFKTAQLGLSRCELVASSLPAAAA